MSVYWVGMSTKTIHSTITLAAFIPCQVPETDSNLGYPRMTFFDQKMGRQDDKSSDGHQGLLILTWINLDHSKDEQSHAK